MKAQPPPARLEIEGPSSASTRVRRHGVDGTTVRVPDSKANRTHFGGQRGVNGECGYPLARVLTLTALRSHLLCAARFGPYTLSEQQWLWLAGAPRASPVQERPPVRQHQQCVQ
jgi:hypothetical protein